MSTVVVVRKDGVAAIAADSRVTMGDDTAADTCEDKILEYGGTYIGLVGSSTSRLVLESILRSTSDLEFHTKSAVYESFRKIHPVLREEHYLNPKEEDDDPFESSHVTALIANDSGIFGVYSMREVYEYNRFWAIGSGGPFAIGAMYASYDSAGVAEQIARIGVTAATQFDVYSAPPITLYTVTLDKQPEV